MTYTGLFVDDEDDVYAGLLTADDKLVVNYLPVEEITDLATKVHAAHPLVVALDYRLDERDQGLSKSQTYKGSGLAQILRDDAIEDPSKDFAIVLVSAERNISRFYRPDRTAHDLFDKIYVKEEILKRPDNIQAELIGLCAGYEMLKGRRGAYDVCSLANLPVHEKEFLDFQELRAAVNSAAAPHIVSKVFLRDIIFRPGPLLDEDNLLAQFGCTLKDANFIFDLVKGAAYDGLFSQPWKRWWTHRVEDIARSIFGRVPTSLTASERATALSQKLGREITPALSPWNKSSEELIAFACACCGRGSEMRHSVAVFEKAIARFSTRRRICWDCVQTDTYGDAHLQLMVDDTDADLAEEVKSKKRETLHR